MNQKVFYLVEDFDPDFNYQGQCVSVMAEASAEMTLRGLSYKLLEDFYSETELRAREETYFHDQLAWFDALDEFLSNRISFVHLHQLKLARSYYRRIKYFCDPLVIQSFMVRSVLKNIGSGKVVYLRKKPEANAARIFDTFGKSDRETFFPELFSRLAREFPEIDFSFHEFGPEPASLTSTKAQVRHCRPNFLKNLYRFFYHKKWKRWLSARKRVREMGFLFLVTGNIRTDYPLWALMEEGGRIFIKGSDGIYDATGFVEKKVFAFGNVEKMILEECRQAAALLENEAYLFNFVNQSCQFDATEILRAPLKYFVENTCSQLIGLTLQFKQFFEKERVHFLFSNDGNELVSAAALAAARSSGGIRSVCIQHGMKIYEDKVWEMTDLDPFDYCLATDGFSEADFKRIVERPYLEPCRIFQSSHYLASLRQTVKPRVWRKAKRQRTLYLPTKFAAHRRCFNNMMIPALTYFENQKALMDYLGTREDCEVIFKKAPRSGRSWDENSIIRYLEEKKFPNIRIEEGETKKHLGWADRVILDRPTTAHFESLAAGIPVLGLNHVFMGSGISPLAPEYLGKTLQVFSSNQEMLKIVAEFLDSDPSQYTVRFPLTEVDLPELFCSLRKSGGFCQKSAVNTPYKSREVRQSGIS